MRSRTRLAGSKVALAAGILAAALAAPVTAPASVSVAVTWEVLVRESSAAAIVAPIESHSAWEDGRICTYTHVRIGRAVAGELATGTDAWVRTLGGAVGKVGQIVEGEAVFSPGRTSLVFLRPGATGALEVTARAQGQFPVVPDADSARPARILRSRATGFLISTRTGTLAADVLHGKVVDEAARDIATAWTVAHAR